MTRGQRGWRTTGVVLLVGVLTLAAAAALATAQPMFRNPTAGDDWTGEVVLVAAAILLVSGVAWMLKILHEDPEADDHWRYRAPRD